MPMMDVHREGSSRRDKINRKLNMDTAATYIYSWLNSSFDVVSNSSTRPIHQLFSLSLSSKMKNLKFLLMKKFHSNLSYLIIPFTTPIPTFNILFAAMWDVDIWKSKSNLISARHTRKRKFSEFETYQNWELLELGERKFSHIRESCFEHLQ